MVILLSHLVCIELFNWTVQADRKHLSKFGVIKGPGGVLPVDGLVCGMCDSDFYFVSWSSHSRCWDICPPVIKPGPITHTTYTCFFVLIWKKDDVLLRVEDWVSEPYNFFIQFVNLAQKKKWPKKLVLTFSDLSFSLSPQQSYAPPPPPMAPPSPGTTTGGGGGGGGHGGGLVEQLSKTNLYIRGLPPATTDQDLIKLCQPWVLLNPLLF